MTSRALFKTIMIMLAATLFLGGCGADPSPPAPDATPDPGGSSAPASTPSSSKPEPASTPTGEPWGEHTWSNGLKVTVLGGEECVPSDLAHPKGIKRAILITIRATNTTAEPYEPGMPLLGVGAKVDGAKTDQVADFTGPCESNVIDFDGLGPNEEQDITIAFAIPEEGGTLTFEIWPDMEDDKYEVEVEI